MKISIVINVDNRPQNDVAETMFNGTVNEDYLVDGVQNKINYFNGFDKELIVYLDKHTEISPNVENYLKSVCDILVIRNHTSEPSFNCWNYWRALSMATGDIVAHFDQDTASFTSSEESVQELIDLLSQYKFISYPSWWSPRAVTDDSFGQRTWASTRFFLCKRETLKLDELKKCIEEPNWGYEKYGDSPRRLNWVEHFLTLINEDSCYYPPMDANKRAIFCWSAYQKGTLGKMNNMTFNEVIEFINNKGGINYPCDVKC